MISLARWLCVSLLVTPLSWHAYGLFMLLPCAVLWRHGRRDTAIGVVGLVAVQHWSPRLSRVGWPRSFMWVFAPAAYLLALVGLWRLRRNDGPDPANHSGAVAR